MQTSIFLAKLMGPILAIAAIAMLVNRKQLDTIVQEVLRGPTLFFLLGLIDFSIGLAIVLTHNVWIADWRLIITVLGWLLLARGAVRLLLPDQIKPFATSLLRNPNVVTGSIAGVLVVGLALGFFGYAR